jgi:hypothetical protein
LQTFGKIRHLAKSGAHVVLAVRSVKAAKNLLEEWQSGQEDLSSSLDVEVIPLPHHPSSLHFLTLVSIGLQITWMILNHLNKHATREAHDTTVNSLSSCLVVDHSYQAWN